MAALKEVAKSSTDSESCSEGLEMPSWGEEEALVGVVEDVELAACASLCSGVELGFAATTGADLAFVELKYRPPPDFEEDTE